MQKILVALSLSVLAACDAAPQYPAVQVRAHADADVAEAAEEPYAVGKRHLAAGQLGLAVERFRAAVARNRADVAALNALASCYDRLGRFDLADRYYDQALALAPTDAQTLNNIGVSSLMRGRPLRAATMLELARKSAPDDAQIAANLARASQAVAQARAAEDKADEDTRPNRIERTGMNAWMLRLGQWLQPAIWVRPPLPHGDEPPPPLAAPRPAVTRIALDAPASAAAPAKITPEGPLRLRILNGAGRRGMAARLRGLLAAKGMAGIAIADAPRFDVRDSVLSYRPGRAAAAAKVATLLPPGVRLELVHDQHDDVRLVLGRDLIPFDLSL